MSDTPKVRSRPAPKAPRPFGPYLRRALRLQCPACGRSSLFLPLRAVRGLEDWFAPVKGCATCGYSFEREPGYFLLATWAINYTFAAAAGLLTWAALSAWTRLPEWGLLLATLTPTALVAFLLIRHSKAVWLALDVYLDPPPGSTPAR